jgi:hypothetical protein
MAKTQKAMQCERLRPRKENGRLLTHINDQMDQTDFDLQ